MKPRRYMYLLDETQTYYDVYTCMFGCATKPTPVDSSWYLCVQRWLVSLSDLHCMCTVLKRPNYLLRFYFCIYTIVIQLTLHILRVFSAYSHSTDITYMCWYWYVIHKHTHTHNVHVYLIHMYNVIHVMYANIHLHVHNIYNHTYKHAHTQTQTHKHTYSIRIHTYIHVCIHLFPSKTFALLNVVLWMNIWREAQQTHNEPFLIIFECVSTQCVLYHYWHVLCSMSQTVSS